MSRVVVNGKFVSAIYKHIFENAVVIYNIYYMKPWSTLPKIQSSFSILFYINHQQDKTQTFWLKAFFGALNNSIPPPTL